MGIFLLGTELIPVVILIIIGILIKYKKAYWLISGYNTMSTEKKKNVDIEGLGKLAANLCFSIAGQILFGAIFIFIGRVTISLLFFGLLIPTIIYFLIKTKKFDGNARDVNGKMKTRTKAMIGIIAGFFILVSIGMGVLIYFTSLPAQYTLNNGILKISGMYGQEIPVNEISKLEIKDSLPEVLYKSNGSDTGNMRKGYFKLNSIGEVKLFVDISKKPFIYIESSSKNIILNCEESEKTNELYRKLLGEWYKLEK